MLLCEMSPFVRYARYLHLNKNTYFNKVVPLDARLFYTLDGYGKIKVENTEYEMTQGSLIIINSGIPYQIMTPKISVNYIAVNFDYTQRAADCNILIMPVAEDEYKKEMLVDLNTFDDVKVLSEVLYIKVIDNIQKKLNGIVREYTQKLLYHEQKSGHMLAECIVDSVRAIKLENVAVKKESSNKIVSYIHEHYAENITNQLIGKLFGYHPNYVSFLIKQVTGMPIHQYIIHVRLINAVNYLENTALSVSEIANACGFCDAAYFSGYFKKYFGVNPSKYRNV